jgi:hypothetical protein
MQANLQVGVVCDCSISDAGDIMIWSDISETPLGLRRRSAAEGDSKTSRGPPGAELGEPRCECTSSSSSSDCFSHPFCTFTMA